MALQIARNSRPLPDAELEADGLAAGELAHARDELEQALRVAELAVGGRRDHRLSLGHASDPRDLGRDLCGGQDSAVAGFRSLGELEFDHAHGVEGGLIAEALGIEASRFAPAAEVAGADLPDQVAALLVGVADPALAGIVREAPVMGAPVESADRVRTERAVAHGRDVEERCGVGTRTLGVADQDAGSGVCGRLRGQ